MKSIIDKRHLFFQADISILRILKFRFVFISLFTIVLFLNSSCKKDEKELNGIMVNIKNASSYDFQDLIFEGAEFGDIEAGMESKYVKFDKVYYNLAFVKLYIDSNEYVLQPIDYDAPELSEGNCTYAIKVVNYEEKKLSIETLLEH